MVIFSYDCVISLANICKPINRGINPTGQHQIQYRQYEYNPLAFSVNYGHQLFCLDLLKNVITEVHVSGIFKAIKLIRKRKKHLDSCTCAEM